MRNHQPFGAVLEIGLGLQTMIAQISKLLLVSAIFY